MRYLLQAIDQLASSQRGKELKLVLAEAREGVDEKNAINDFYETLERIVNELRNTTEHSTAFLNKVRKAEAPNYYDVIKRPMDLGTVLKKVKGQQYKDKKSFAADLELIWTNCMEYNTLPTHPLRHSAQELRKKANNALQYVNDIAKPSYGTPLGRETPDVEVDSEEDAEADDTGATRKGTVSRKRGAQEAAKSRARATSEAVASQPDDDMDVDHASRDSSPVSQSQRASSLAGRRRTLTTKTDLVPFDERPALVRTRDGMTRFVAVEGGPIDEPVASTSAVTLDMPLPVPTGGSTTNSPSPASKPLPLPLQQLLPNGRASRPPAPKSEPMAPSLSVDTEKDAVQTWWEAAGSADLLRNGLPRCRFVDAPPETLLEPLFDDESGNAIALRMAGNLAILRQIRRRRQELLRGSESDTMAEDEYAPQPDLAPSLPFTPPLPSRLIAGDASAPVALRSVLVASLAHAGFDAASAEAVDVLLTLVAELLGNLGRTVRILYDRMSDRISRETLMIAVLEENGTAHPAELEQYIQRDVYGHGNRLRELLQRLKAADALDPTASYETADLPPEGCVRRQVFDAEAEGKHSTAPLRFDPPPPYVPLDEGAIVSQIGLLQPTYRARLATEHLLYEDDVDPVKTKLFRPKVPPSGKVPTKRRAEKEAGGPKKAKKPKKATSLLSTSAAAPGLGGRTQSSPEKMEVDEPGDLFA